MEKKNSLEQGILVPKFMTCDLRQVTLSETVSSKLT